MVVGGHKRLQAALSLGWTEISAQILDIPAQEAVLAGLADNQGRQMSWLELYSGIEAAMKADPSLTQAKVGASLGVDRTSVSRALKIMGCLGPEARHSICDNVTKPGGYEVSERTVYRLTGLVDEQNAVNTGVFEKCLQIVLEKRFTEAKTKALVKWVKDGNEPQSYVQSPMSKAKPAPSPKSALGHSALDPGPNQGSIPSAIHIPNPAPSNVADLRMLLDSQMVKEALTALSPYISRVKQWPYAETLVKYMISRLTALLWLTGGLNAVGIFIYIWLPALMGLFVPQTNGLYGNLNPWNEGLYGWLRTLANVYLWVLFACLIRDEIERLNKPDTSVPKSLGFKALIFWAGFWVVLKVIYWLGISGMLSRGPEVSTGWAFPVVLNHTLAVCIWFFVLQWLFRKLVSKYGLTSNFKL